MHDVATHDDSKGQYFWVWGALLVLTAIEVVLGYKQVFSACADAGGPAGSFGDQVGTDHRLLHALEV